MPMDRMPEPGDVIAAFSPSRRVLSTIILGSGSGSPLPDAGRAEPRFALA